MPDEKVWCVQMREFGDDQPSVHLFREEEGAWDFAVEYVKEAVDEYSDE